MMLSILFKNIIKKSYINLNYSYKNEIKLANIVLILDK